VSLGLADIRGFIPLVLKFILYLRSRFDPALRQAARFLKAFEAHGIARMQIGRLLPVTLRSKSIPLASFSSADALKPVLTAELLDWTADLWGLQRTWLDLAGGSDSYQGPHRHCHVYKDPEAMAVCLDEALMRIPVSPLDLRMLVFATTKEAFLQPTSDPIVIALEEPAGELDDQLLHRYTMLSEGWQLDHTPCLINAVSLCRMATERKINIRGVVVSHRELKRLVLGRSFIPEARRKCRGIWYPEDVLDDRRTGRSHDLTQLRNEVNSFLGTDRCAKR